MTGEPTVVQALSAVMADVQAVRKGDRNEAQGFKFRGIDAVINAVGPALREHGVVVLPILEAADYGQVEIGHKRTLMRECTVRVRFRFVGPAGDTLDAVVPGEALDSGDKATAKAMSVAFRIALLQALCIPTDEPDADSHTYERASAQPARRLARQLLRDEIHAGIETLSHQAQAELKAWWAEKNYGSIKGGAHPLTDEEAAAVLRHLDTLRLLSDPDPTEPQEAGS